MMTTLTGPGTELDGGNAGRTAKNNEASGWMLRWMKGVLGWTRGRMLGWMEEGLEQRKGSSSKK